MSRGIHKLSARQVATISKPGRYSDGGGLYLRINEKGQKKWVLRYTPAPGRPPREMGLGKAGPTFVSLADARTLAYEARSAVREGVDPIKERQKEQQQAEGQIPLFGDFADRFVSQQASGFRNDKHIAQWKMTLTKYAAPIRGLPVDEITTDQILDILQPIWETKHETANRLRGRIERVLNAAKALGLRSGENPAQWRGHLELLLPKQSKLKRGHFAAMPYQEVPAFMAKLRKREGVSPRAMEFLILAACRSGEVRHLEWDDLNIPERVWTIPAHKMKAGKEHRVPLTDRMLKIITKVRPLSKDHPFVFASRKGTPLSDATLSAVLKRMGHSDVTVHGFRSSFRDWAGDATDYPREVAEEALAHVVGNATERAYRRGDAFGKRIGLMDDWHEFINSDASGRSIKT